MKRSTERPWTMDSSIRNLFDEKKITARAALDKAIDKSLFKELAEGGA